MAENPSETEQLKRRNEELAILNTIAHALNGELDLARALHTALSQVALLLDLQTGWVWLLNQETGDAYLAAAQSLPRGLRDEPRRMEGTCYCLDTYRAGDLSGAANVNVVTCSRLRNLVSGTDGLRYHASIPLYAQGKKLGVMNVASANWRQLSPADLRLLYTIGDLVSIAIERARLFEQSVQLGAAEERNRLAREIHDTLAQGLAAIALRLETADALLEAGVAPDRARSTIQQALDLTRQNLDEARRSVLDLRAAPLEGRSLPDALAALAGIWHAGDGPPMTLSITGESTPLPVRIELALYRIAQEALHNIRRHAAAQNVAMSLNIKPEEVRLAVEDDGQGFDPAGVPEGRYGLIGVQERVRLLRGAFALSSAPGEGTRLEVVVPLDRMR